MTRIIMWSLMSVLLHGVLITLAMLVAVVYFYKGKQKEDVNDRVMLYGFAFLLLFDSVFSRIFSFIAMMLIPGTYENYTFYATEYDATHPSSMSVFFSLLSLFSFIVAPTIFFYTFERIFKRTRYVLTITSIALIISNVLFRIFLSSELIFVLLWNTSNFIFITFLIIMIIYTRMSNLEGKAVASFFYLWVSIVILGNIYSTIGYSNLSANIIAYVLWIIGTLMFLVPMVINPKYLSRALVYWRISGVSVGILYLVTWILVIFIYEIPNPLLFLYLLEGIMTRGIAFMVVYFFIARSIKYEGPLEEKEGVSRGYGAFVKPQMLTEEEVSISKEKKICLVCKGKLAGFNLAFICSGCDTIYCENCARALAIWKTCVGCVILLSTRPSPLNRI